MSSTPASPADVDVLIIGAGISGIGAAYHLKTKRPGTTFALVDGREAIGGTWDLFRYPGLRSDSDLHTFGFAFKPWTHENAIAGAPEILAYLDETVDENDLRRHIRFGHRVLRAAFDSADGRWTVQTETADGTPVEMRARFLFSGTGYYDYAGGHSPAFAGIDDFGGQVVHPQQWPEDLDYAGRRVLVIGSGATAVTLVPALAPLAGHVTMLQRSPSYVMSLPAKDPIANGLNRVLGPERAYPLTRRKNVFVQRALYRAARRFPSAVARALIADVRRRLPKGYDVGTHFTPSYGPWDQRLCMVPNGDLFRTIRRGQADVVTGHIERFTVDGVRLTDGRELAADIVVTATGLNLLAFGGIALSVDGDPVDVAGTTVFRSMMLSDVPNFAFALGYTNASWTLKVDLVCEHFCRLLDTLDAQGRTIFVPRVHGTVEPAPILDLNSGYVTRAIASFPNAGTRGPWTVEHAYEKDVARLRRGPVEDPELELTSPVAAPSLVG